MVEQLTFNQWVTGSNPVALTTFPYLDSGNKYNDLTNKSLKTLPNLKYQSLKRTYLIPNTFLKNRSKLPPKSIKVSCKCHVKISRVHRDRARGSQVCVLLIRMIILTVKKTKPVKDFLLFLFKHLVNILNIELFLLLKSLHD